MIYMRDTYTAIKDETSCFMTSKYEILCVDVEIGNIKYKIYVCYRPPNRDKDSMQALYKKLTELKTPVTKNRKVIIMGDFNIDLLTRRDIEDSQAEEFCTNTDVCQLINEVTRPKSGTLLDHIYINDRIHNVCEFGTISYHISDHTPVFVLIKCIQTKIKKKIIKARSYKNYDVLKFKNMLLSVKWDDVLSIDNPDEMWDSMLRLIRACLDSICPIRTMILPVYTPEWLTPNIIQEMQYRDDLYKDARRSNDIDDWRIADFL